MVLEAPVRSPGRFETTAGVVFEPLVFSVQRFLEASKTTVFADQTPPGDLHTTIFVDPELPGGLETTRFVDPTQTGGRLDTGFGD